MFITFSLKRIIILAQDPQKKMPGDKSKPDISGLQSQVLCYLLHCDDPLLPRTQRIYKRCIEYIRNISGLKIYLACKLRLCHLLHCDDSLLARTQRIYKRYIEYIQNMSGLQTQILCHFLHCDDPLLARTQRKVGQRPRQRRQKAGALFHWRTSPILSRCHFPEGTSNPHNHHHIYIRC